MKRVESVCAKCKYGKESNGANCWITYHTACEMNHEDVINAIRGTNKAKYTAHDLREIRENVPLNCEFRLEQVVLCENQQ